MEKNSVGAWLETELCALKIQGSYFSMPARAEIMPGSLSINSEGF